MTLYLKIRLKWWFRIVYTAYFKILLQKRETERKALRDCIFLTRALNLPEIGVKFEFG